MGVNARLVVLALTGIATAGIPGPVLGQSDVGAGQGWVERATVLGERLVHGLEAAFEALADHAWGRAATSAQEAEFRWTGRLDSGDVLEIKGVNGSITALPARGAEVEVRARKRGRDDDPDEVRVEVIEHGGGVTLCAVYPTPPGERENHCAPGEEGRNSVRRNDVRVDFEVWVPDGVRFHGRNVNGDVDVEGLDGDVEVSTVNGDVEVSTEGFAEASTVNGSIRASVGSPIFRDGVTFRTVNGSIHLDVPDDIDADIDARWVNGGLDTDLPIEIRGRVSRRRARGVLGRGGPTLRLTTVNGSIRVY